MSEDLGRAEFRARHARTPWRWGTFAQGCPRPRDQPTRTAEMQSGPRVRAGSALRPHRGSSRAPMGAHRCSIRCQHSDPAPLHSWLAHAGNARRQCSAFPPRWGGRPWVRAGCGLQAPTLHPFLRCTRTGACGVPGPARSPFRDIWQQPGCSRRICADRPGARLEARDSEHLTPSPSRVQLARFSSTTLCVQDLRARDAG
jgi:hypothetical protein